ncbi:DUF5677 domain-containing protein [Cellulophaga sp. Ld12]|uniref:DUF5677 domain-containing protein n=1 Tax=Cellulophaga sp. Ld12 TaxID=3229535 RepID=UPI00386E2D3E
MEFSERIERIRDLDDEVFDIFQQSQFLILPFLKNSKIPKTTELFLMFITGTNFIKNSIFDCIENDDVYSSKILFRSLIEHFLRFKFIYINYLTEKSDSKSEYYYTILEISEYLSLSKSIKAVNKINGIDEQTIVEMWTELCENFPKLKTYDKKEVEDFTRNFSIKNIITFLTETISKSDPKEFLLSKMIIEYSELSSFVHGGIFAYQSCFQYSNESERQKEQERIAGLTYQLCGTIKYFSYLIWYQFDKEFGPLYLKTEELIKRI